MAVQAAVTKFKDEMVLSYEQRRSLLSTAATPEFMKNGLTVTFLVHGSGGAGVQTRGANGDISYGGPTNTQVSATLVEKHAAEALTGFDIFASQGNQTMGLQTNVFARIRRDQDDVILTELDNATQDFGSGILDLNTITGAKAILGNANVPTEEEDNMFAIISHAAEAYLLQMTEFTSADYVDVKPLTGGPVRKYKRWMGLNWIVSSRISGAATASEKLFIYHRAALGYACAMGAEKLFAGFDEQQGRSWARAEVFHAAKIIQNSGIVRVAHDGSAFVAT